MAGLLTPPGDVFGGIAEFLLEQKICATPMPHHEPPCLYIQRLQVLLFLDNQTITIKEITDVDYDVSLAVVATVDLTDPGSLDLLVRELNNHQTTIEKRRWTI